MEGEIIEVSFELSVCLHLNKNSKFALKVDGRDIEVSTVDVLHEYTRFGRGVNMEIYSDIDSGFRYSQIKMTFVDPDPTIPLEKISTVYEDFILEATNKFIDAYRFVTGRVAISNISSISDLLGIQCGRPSPSGAGQFVVAINFGGVGIGGKHAGMGPFKPNLGADEEEKIRELLSSENIPLEDYFLMDAKRHMQIGHKIQALVSAVIAA